ncbi:MAG: hypothetical protein RBR97_02140 [Bacteroidales bacterium]|nr:hypothetical protein [Bacteroidales bacterium]
MFDIASEQSIYMRCFVIHLGIKQNNIIRNTSNRKNWQNYYYDSIIKIDVDYSGVKQYIIDNLKKMGL